MLTQAAGNCWSHSFFFCSDIFGFWVKNNHLFARWMQMREKNCFNNHRLKAGFIKRSILAFYLRIGLQQNMWHVTSVPSVKTSDHFVRLRLRTKKKKSIADTFSSQMSSHLFSSALQMEAFDFSPTGNTKPFTSLRHTPTHTRLRRLHTSPWACSTRYFSHSEHWREHFTTRCLGLCSSSKHTINV